MMKVIDIKNKDILKALDAFLWFYDNPMVPKNINLECPMHNRGDWVSDKYRDQIIAMNTKHDGFPDAGRYYNVKPDRLNPTRNADDIELRKIMDKFGECNSNLSSLLCTRNNATWCH